MVVVVVVVVVVVGGGGVVCWHSAVPNVIFKHVWWTYLVYKWTTVVVVFIVLVTP